MKSFLRVDLYRGILFDQLEKETVFIAINGEDEPICDFCNESTEESSMTSVAQEYEISGIPTSLKKAQCFYCPDCGYAYLRQEDRADESLPMG